MKKRKSSILLILILVALSSCEPINEKVIYHRSAETENMGLPFSDAVRVGNMLYLSGQIGNKPGELKLVEGGIGAEAKQTMENIKKVLEAHGSSLEHTIKFTVFINDISQWSEFNKVYMEYFGDHLPARSALGADGLALGAAIEVECIAYIPE